MMTSREEMAAKLLERNLVSTHDEALVLADKFLEMDSQEMAVVGTSKEAAEGAQQALAQVLYYERIELVSSGSAPFRNARVEVEEAPKQRPEDNPQAAAQIRLQNTKVDITEFFNVGNLKKAQES